MTHCIMTGALHAAVTKADGEGLPRSLSDITSMHILRKRNRLAPGALSRAALFASTGRLQK